MRLFLDLPIPRVDEQYLLVVFFGKETKGLLVGFVGNLVFPAEELLDVMHLVDLLEESLGEMLRESGDDVDFIVLGDLREELLEVGTQLQKVELRVLVQRLDFQSEDLGVLLHVAILFIGEADILDLQAENVLLLLEEVDPIEDVLRELAFFQGVFRALERNEGVKEEEDDEEDVGHYGEDQLEDQHDDVDDGLEDSVEVEKNQQKQLEEDQADVLPGLSEVEAEGARVLQILHLLEVAFFLLVNNGVLLGRDDFQGIQLLGPPLLLDYLLHAGIHVLDDDVFGDNFVEHVVLLQIVFPLFGVVLWDGCIKPRVFHHFNY